ncbi:malonyl-CoA O-methyltransferase [Methylophilus rhizosphaerae]|uniref:Malonyl-[acyl-carrier protein] O-methyltransferase n=1 Tax=Methylophilus rhizosphaerae TaxID=492660 RepID=A0A1G9F1M9_9PROT|nr:malonyl-ACP O-methyltransferase BioC [Methylophilus rhizosphaerae]SDK82173.1 malonyl-CoA O-methyltransferase [Methylophilus rhizosphaerae]
MQDEYQIDKSRMRQSFHRAAKQYDAAAILQRQVREEMLSRLDVVKLDPEVILDAGCGTGHGLSALLKHFKQAQGIALDIAEGMLVRSRTLFPRYKFWQASPRFVCADIESLPLATASVDMVWSNLAMQWCNDLDAALQEFRRVLRPNGLLMFATLGPDTLRELRAASGAGHTHVSRFIDMHDIGDALTRAGFSAPVLDVMHYTLTYESVESVMRDLKAIGAHNATVGRAKGLSGKGFLQQLRQGYETFRHDGKLPATYEVVFVHAWTGSQPYTAPGTSPVQFMPRKDSQR